MAAISPARHSWFCVPVSQRSGNFSGAGAKFVGTQPLQLLALAEENSEVRPEELVAGARQEVAIQSANVNRPMRRVMYRIDEGHGTGRMRQPHNLVAHR